MGYIFDFKNASVYDTWFEQPKNRYCLDLEIKLMIDLLSPKKGQRILDIGCGTGKSLEPLMEKGLNLTGIDPSQYMLDAASKKIKQKADLHKAFAEDLPFEDNAFDSAVFFTSLEFTERPAKAVEEACRVAKDSVVIIVLNRHAPLNIIRKLKSLFIPSLYVHARFFSIWELKQILSAILGNVPITWKTTLQFPFASGRVASYIENIGIVQKSFFGTMIGMRIKPVPKFRSRPMALKIKKHKGYTPATGLVRIGMDDNGNPYI
ncbi:MAG: class I SAM-dependent methyltransferase [Desulfobacteraceae bacterium]|nr:class I SAM-dependent methyltransferase [Desulfobacteraceae bacterium]